MKAEILLLIACSIVAGFLYAGLPEEAPSQVRSPKADIGESSDAPALQERAIAQPELEREVKRLRRQQAVLTRQLQSLDRQLRAVGLRNDAKARQSQDRIDLEEGSGDAPGLTVFLSAPELSHDEGRAAPWTAISFRDAGAAPDGSHQAVMSIHSDLATPRAPAAVQRIVVPRWQ